MKRPIDPSELPAGGDARARPTQRRRIPQRGHPTHRFLGARMAAQCSRFCCWNLFGTRGRDAGRAPAFPVPLQCTRSLPIRTAARMPLEVALVRAAPVLPYQAVAGRAALLSRLGMPASAIARRLSVSDKTVAKAIRWADPLRTT